MSLSNTLENQLLLLIFNNTDLGLIGDATGLRGSTTAGSLFVSLHNADPGEAGDQTTNEISYTGYSRVAVARNAGGWTVTGNTVSNTAAVTFGACTAGSATASHVGIGASSTAAGKLILKGALAASLSITSAPQITPNFAIGAISITAD